MATIALQSAKAVKTISGNSPQTMFFPEAATQTFKTGEFVYLVSGKVTEISDTATLTILGMAAMDATGVTDTPIAVYIANEDTIFELNKVSNAVAAGTGGTAAVTAVTDVGTIAAIYRDTTHNIANANWYAFGGSERLFCIGLSEKDVVGDTGGRVLCMVTGRFRQLYSTS